MATTNLPSSRVWQSARMEEDIPPKTSVGWMQGGRSPSVSKARQHFPMKNPINYALRRILSRLDVSTCLAAAESNRRGNGGSTIRVEIVGEKYHIKTVDSAINAGYLLPHVS